MSYDLTIALGRLCHGGAWVQVLLLRLLLKLRLLQLLLPLAKLWELRLLLLLLLFGHVAPKLLLALWKFWNLRWARWRYNKFFWVLCICSAPYDARKSGNPPVSVRECPLSADAGIPPLSLPPWLRCVPLLLFFRAPSSASKKSSSTHFFCAPRQVEVCTAQ